MIWYYYFHLSITDEKIIKLICSKTTKPVKGRARMRTQPVRFQNPQWFWVWNNKIGYTFDTYSSDIENRGGWMKK